MARSTATVDPLRIQRILEPVHREDGGTPSTDTGVKRGFHGPRGLGRRHAEAAL